MSRGSRPRVIALLLLVFALRLGFGLCSDLYSEDETQIYLLGLKYHATHAWPYYGADVVWTKSQIPGALQALVVGAPMDVLAIPEAPYILLNLLSMAALCLFAWYLCRRVPAAPRWLVWGRLLTVPWTLNFSTHIMNPDYVLPASVVFFIGFFEAFPPLSLGWIRPWLALAMMGAALGWIAQIHMSWPLLLPFLGVALMARLREGSRASMAAVVGLFAGALVTGSLLLPTYLKFGLTLGSGSTGANLHLHWREPISTFVKTAARMLSFASLETNRFIASGSGKQIIFLWQHRWLLPLAATVALVGIAHPLWMALTAFRRRAATPGWAAMRWLIIGTTGLVSLSFFLVMEPAQARMYYVMAPVALAYSVYCWTFIDSPFWRRVAATALGINVLFQILLTSARFPGASIYLDRPLVAQAIRQDDPEIFSRRRVYARDASPADREAAAAAASAPADLDITEAALAKPLLNLTTWSLVIHNRSATTAYRDLTCRTTYSDRRGAVLEQHDESIWIVIQPGESRRVEVVDGVKWTPETTGAEPKIVAALAVKPSGG